MSTLAVGDNKLNAQHDGFVSSEAAGGGACTGGCHVLLAWNSERVLGL